LHRSCFSWGLILAVRLAAADGLAAPAPQPVHMTSVVRSDQHTGRLVRSVVVNAKPVSERKIAGTVVAARVVAPASPAPSAATPERTQSLAAYGDINRMVAEAAAHESLPSALIHSVIKVESNYDPLAISPKGAQGLMQLIPETAQRFGVNNAFSPAENIQGGAKYLRYLLELYKGDYVRALAAYNAGEGAVARYGGVPPYAETRNYLVQVSKQLEKSMAGHSQPGTAAGNSQPKPVETQSAPADGAKGDGVTHLQQIVQPDGTVRYVSR